MSQTGIIPGGDDRPPHQWDRLIVLALLAVVLITVLVITDDITAAVSAVAALLAAYTALMRPALTQ